MLITVASTADQNPTDFVDGEISISIRTSRASFCRNLKYITKRKKLPYFNLRKPVSLYSPVKPTGQKLDIEMHKGLQISL